MSKLLTRKALEQRVKINGRVKTAEAVKGKLYYIDVAASLVVIGYGFVMQSGVWIGIGVLSVGVALLRPSQWLERKIKQRITGS